MEKDGSAQRREWNERFALTELNKSFGSGSCRILAGSFVSAGRYFSDLRERKNRKSVSHDRTVRVQMLMQPR